MSRRPPPKSFGSKPKSSGGFPSSHAAQAPLQTQQQIQQSYAQIPNVKHSEEYGRILAYRWDTCLDQKPPWGVMIFFESGIAWYSYSNFYHLSDLKPPNYVPRNKSLDLLRKIPTVYIRREYLKKISRSTVKPKIILMQFESDPDFRIKCKLFRDQIIRMNPKKQAKDSAVTKLSETGDTGTEATDSTPKDPAADDVPDDPVEDANDVDDEASKIQRKEFMFLQGPDCDYAVKILLQYKNTGPIIPPPLAPPVPQAPGDGTQTSSETADSTANQKAAAAAASADRKPTSVSFPHYKSIAQVHELVFRMYPEIKSAYSELVDFCGMNPEEFWKDYKTELEVARIQSLRTEQPISSKIDDKIIRNEGNKYNLVLSDEDKKKLFAAHPEIEKEFNHFITVRKSPEKDFWTEKFSRRDATSEQIQSYFKEKDDKHESLLKRNCAGMSLRTDISENAVEYDGHGIYTKSDELRVDSKKARVTPYSLLKHAYHVLDCSKASKNEISQKDFIIESLKIPDFEVEETVAAEPFLPEKWKGALQIHSNADEPEKNPDVPLVTSFFLRYETAKPEQPRNYHTALQATGRLYSHMHDEASKFGKEEEMTGENIVQMKSLFRKANTILKKLYEANYRTGDNRAETKRYVKQVQEVKNEINSFRDGLESEARAKLGSVIGSIYPQIDRALERFHNVLLD